MTTPPATADTLARLRSGLGFLLFMGLLGTLAELLLGGHYEESWQWAPLVLLGLGLLAQLAVAAAPGRGTIYLLRVLLVLFIPAGILGSAMHLQGKFDFVHERFPTLIGMPLIREALKGSSPPILAPGAMIALALLGLLWTWRHPALEPPADPTGESP